MERPAPPAPMIKTGTCFCLVEFVVSVGIDLNGYQIIEITIWKSMVFAPKTRSDEKVEKHHSCC